MVLVEKLWGYFRAIFDANGLEVADDDPGICGSGQPAGSFVAAAKYEGRQRVDGDFLLNFLLAGRPEADRRQIEDIPRPLLVDLCLCDREIPSNSGFERLVHRLETSGGYFATRELYQLLGLAPPHEIVSFDERVRLRFEDADQELANEVGHGIAVALTEGDVRQRPDEGLVLNIRQNLLRTHLKELEVLLLWSFASVPEPGLLQTATTWVAEGERDPALGARRLLIALHSDPTFSNSFKRGVILALSNLHIDDPRPRGAKAPVSGQARPLAAVLTVGLDETQIVSAAWRRQDPAHPDELAANLGDKIKKHYDQIARSMPRLGIELFDGEALQKLIVASGAAVEIERVRGERLKRLNCVSAESNGRYRWRWRSDEFFARLTELSGVNASNLAAYYLFAPEDWPAIAAAIHRAYGDDLITKDGDTLRPSEPLGLLQFQYTSARQRLLHRLDGYLDEVASAEERENWRERLREIGESLPRTSNDCEAGLDRVLSAEEQLQAAELSAAEARVRRREQLEALNGQLQAERPPGELVADYEELRTEVGGALESGRDAEALCRRGSDLLRRSNRHRADAQARALRASSLLTEITELREKAAGQPKSLALIDEAAKRLEREAESVEEVAADIERAKIVLVERAAEPRTPQPVAARQRFEVFRKTEDDLARLAELYRRGVIVSAEVR